MEQLHKQLQDVTDEASFVAFVSALAEDRRKNAASWQNDSIEAFLDAALSWAEDSEMGRSQGLASASPWKRAAVFLYAGKIYE